MASVIELMGLGEDHPTYVIAQNIAWMKSEFVEIEGKPLEVTVIAMVGIAEPLVVTHRAKEITETLMKPNEIECPDSDG